MVWLAMEPKSTHPRLPRKQPWGISTTPFCVTYEECAWEFNINTDSGYAGPTVYEAASPSCLPCLLRLCTPFYDLLPALKECK